LFRSVWFFIGEHARERKSLVGIVRPFSGGINLLGVRGSWLDAELRLPDQSWHDPVSAFAQDGNEAGFHCSISRGLRHPGHSARGFYGKGEPGDPAPALTLLLPFFGPCDDPRRDLVLPRLVRLASTRALDARLRLHGKHLLI
jgi:hypothetical protein